MKKNTSIYMFLLMLFGVSLPQEVFEGYLLFTPSIIGNDESASIVIPGHRLTVAIDAINPIDYTLYGAMGMEYAYADMFFVRAGTHFGHDTADMSLGAGLQINTKAFSVGLDYAYVNYGILEETHQYSISLEF